MLTSVNEWIRYGYRNMIYNLDPNTVHDWLPIVISSIAIIISMIVAYIGYLQYKTNHDQLRLNLYNRRFAVYEKVIQYYLSYYSSSGSTAESIEKTKKEFIQAYRESKFLFGEDSDVYKNLTKLKDIMSDDKRDIVPKNPTEIMHALEIALMSWLDFKKIAK